MAPLSRDNSEVRTPEPDRKPLEIVFSFDTTGSMSSCLGKVREQMQTIMERLSTDIPTLRMAVFAHGDYCDASNYVTKWHDFTTNTKDLCDFVRNVGGTGGGDFPEAYELVLRQVREELSWTAGTQRSLVMIGDAIPHEPSYPQNKLKIDWREEVDKLYNEMGVQIYSVQCQSNNQAEEFFKTMAEKTNGTHLHLEKFETIVDMMMSIVYKEHGAEYFEAYEKEVRAREGAGIRWELDRMLNRLADREPSSTTVPAPATAIAHTSFGSPVFTTIAPAPATSIATATKSPIRGTKAGGIKAKASKDVNKRIKKVFKTKLIPRKREDVKNTQLLGQLCWSKWQNIISPEKQVSKTNSWHPRRSAGFQRRDVFDSTQTPAIYELSVVTPDEAQKKVTVWQGYSKGFQNKSLCNHFFASKPAVKGHIDTLVKRGCKLYARRATEMRSDEIQANGKCCSTLDEMANLVRQTYDYAWAGKSEPRQLFLRRSKRSTVTSKNGHPY